MPGPRSAGGSGNPEPRSPPGPSPCPAFRLREGAPTFDAAWFDTVFLVPDPPAAWPSHFAIVTAHNPGAVIAPTPANRERDRELQRYLQSLGLASFVVIGASPDLQHCEPGRGFPASSVADATAVAERFGQKGFFWVQDGEVYVAVDGSGCGWRVAPWTQRLRTLP